MELFNKYILQILYFIVQLNTTNTINTINTINTTTNNNPVNVPSDSVVDSTIFYEDE